MTTIELTVDESLLAEVDRVTHLLAMSRSNFIRVALELALRNQQTIALERQHAQGYAKLPSKPDEFAEWESEQVWGES
jgi:metal-responsive CopG/Arc/MetJ family transcriptional regulator